MQLSEITRMLEGRLIGADASFQGVSLNSRTIQPDQLFIAYKGKNADGHDFLDEAKERGAIGALVLHPVESTLPQVVVHDIRMSLGEIASYYRQQLTMPIIALTGSCGKTTTKTLIAKILSKVGKVHSTEGTLNNDYGMPLTLLNASKKDKFVVLEMGANHPQEIAYLTYIARPTIALITNAGPVHLEGFKDIQGVARAKGEIFQGLAQNGVAIINIDDVFGQYWQEIAAGNPYITFGLNTRADVYADQIQVHSDGSTTFHLHTLSGSGQVNLALIGKHNIMNALAATAVGIAAGASTEQICAGLSEVISVDKRLMPRVGLNGMTIIDDTYNANPRAMEIAVDVLMELAGEKVFVTGDMGELGAEAVKFHRQLGEMARLAGVNRLYAVGELSLHTAEAFGEKGYHFHDQAALIEALQVELKPNICMLVKGSRSAKMENVVQALLPKTETHLC
ncbi:MAG: UDP-N-acetylmuramoyl-tripeptide--D-alanyl-D-alanine ligase [Legionellales bacterium]|nr:UDP-N-acetylmuramoyl-tripeptide--D-alanyl-D-alanine ligase [Legionellales bacterium]